MLAPEHLSATFLPGDEVLGTEVLAIIFFITVEVIIFAFVIILWSHRHASESGRDGMAKHERVYAIIIIVAVLAYASFTLGLLPYPYAHPDVRPAMTINVVGQQFSSWLAD